MLGTNQFPNFTETSEGKRSMGKTCCCGHKDEEAAPFKSIQSTRLAADFEDLRIQTEESGKVPTAFMLTIGSLAWRQARAQFSCNFLACGGYKVIDNLGFETVEEGVDAALAAGADIVVLCSSDDEYAEYAEPAFNYLNGRAMFIVAGAPACMEDLKAKGSGIRPQTSEDQYEKNWDSFPADHMTDETKAVIKSLIDESLGFDSAQMKISLLQKIWRTTAAVSMLLFPAKAIQLLSYPLKEAA